MTATVPVTGGATTGGYGCAREEARLTCMRRSEPLGTGGPLGGDLGPGGLSYMEPLSCRGPLFQ